MKILLFLSALIASIFTTKDDKVTVLLTGDIMLGRSVMSKSLDSGNFNHPFMNVSDKLRDVDIVFSNLENPFVSKCPKSDSGFKFCADPQMAEGLVFAGIDIVNLANNHSLNYGLEGLESTKDVLSKHQIKWVGRGNLEIIQKDKTKFGFLGFDFVTHLPSIADYQLVKDSNSKVDVLIIGVHWGNEYTAIANSHQIEIAKKLVENGGDIIVGHHPHWVQNIEYIDDKPIYYSLGNFIFDQMWSEETKKGMAIELQFQDNKLIGESRLPIYMANFAQPEWVK